MENCIYHSRDLDGLTSGAIVYSHQQSFGEDCNLYGFDYGEKLDTRKFKGSSVIMIDVSMPMERMEILGSSAMEFIWIDHHLSAYEELHRYCGEKGYEIKKTKYNDLVERIEVCKMNLVYFYSERLSGCEITLLFFGKHLGRNSQKIISALGQYDTWRNNDEKKFSTDRDWHTIVLPVQYYMRSFERPIDIIRFLSETDDWRNPMEIEKVAKMGKAVLNYQEIQNKSVSKNHFEFNFEGLNVVALNTVNFNSSSFKGIYFPEIHDAMMAFRYDGSQRKFLFSLYTEGDADILSVVKKFGGGGHKKACGFSIDDKHVQISSGEIHFVNEVKNEGCTNDTPFDPSVLTKEIPSKKGYTHNIGPDGVDYLIPNIFVNKYTEMVNGDRIEFDKIFKKYIYEEK